jgi:hypothetical protein
MGHIPTYDIFSGSRDKDALWLEAVQGLGAACDRMKELAAQTKGPYFVFCTSTHKVLASVDTSQDLGRHDEDVPESA